MVVSKLYNKINREKKKTNLLFSGPQIVFSLYGNNIWGTETSRGYARIHVPLCGSEQLYNAPIFVAKCSSMWAAAVSFMSDRSPELRDPKLLAEGLKNKSKVFFLCNFFFILIEVIDVKNLRDRVTI